MISLKFSFILASLSLNDDCDQLLSISNTTNLRLIVCFNLSTMPVPLWSPTAASTNSMILFLQKK